ncbi:MAG TPA: DUF4013 domain-containing protein [Anaerolineales bacterium]
MDFGLAFSFPFQDEKWVTKLLIAAGLSLIPVIGQIVVLGWSLEITRRVIQGNPEPLPDWSDFGGYLMLGLKGLVVGFVLSLPMILFGILYGVGTGVVASAMDPDAGATVASLLSICFACFAFLYGLVIAVGAPAAMGILAATDQIGAALSPGSILAHFRAAVGPYIIAILGVWVVFGIVGPLGIIACGIGLFVTQAYAFVVSGHLYGQAYNAATAAGAGSPVM